MYDDDEFALLPPDDPRMQGRVLASNLRGNPFMPPSKFPAPQMSLAPEYGGAEQQPARKPETSDDIIRRIDERMARPPDAAALIEHAKTREAGSNRKLALALALGSTGGESMQGFAGGLRDQALKESTPYEIPGGWGTATSEGVVWNPAKQQEADLNHMTKILASKDKRETAVEARRNRDEAQAREFKFRRETEEGRREDRQSAAADRRAARGDAAADREEASTTRRTDAIRREYNTRWDKLNASNRFASDVMQLTTQPDISKNAPAQIAVVMQFGKMLDPESVVRTEEQKMIMEARGVLGSLEQLPDKIRMGTFLTPQQLKYINEVAVRYQQGAKGRQDAFNQFYTGVAQRNRLRIDDIIQGGSPKSDAPSAGGGGRGSADSPLRIERRQPKGASESFAPDGAVPVTF